MEEKATATGAEQKPGCFFCTTAMPLLEHLWSGVARDHFRNSRIEFLMGVRSMIDERIAHLKHEDAKGTHVPVE